MLGVNPVLVESSESSLVEVVGPDSGKGSKSSGGFNVSDETNNLKRRGFDDGTGFNLFLFVEFGLGSVDISENVGHASLESTESGEVRSLGPVISGERSDSTVVVFGSVSGQESEVTFSGTTEFSMGHIVVKYINIKLISTLVLLFK